MRDIIKIYFKDDTVISFHSTGTYDSTQVMITDTLLKVYQAGTCYCYPISTIKNFEFDEDLEVFDYDEDDNDENY